MKNTSPFDLERQRDILAKKGKLNELRRLYGKELPEIEDLNTGSLWDRLNFESEFRPYSNPSAYDKLKIVAKLIPNGCKTILNIGVGSANLEKLVLVGKKEIKWVGVDISSEAARRAQEIFPTARFHNSSILKTSLKNNGFCTAIAMEVLEHIKPSEIFSTLKKIRGLLKKGGTLIVTVPINEDLENLVNSGKNSNAHLRIYTKDLIEAELKIAGFRVIKMLKIYAFRRQYALKKVIVTILPWLREPNNLVIIAQKP